MNNRHQCIIALIMISICISLSSVNSSEIPCTDLQKYAAEKGSPIVYDEETNEYHIKYKQENGGEASIIIRYCPSCGAEAPKSIRENLFCKVSEAENVWVELNNDNTIHGIGIVPKEKKQ